MDVIQGYDPVPAEEVCPVSIPGFRRPHEWRLSETFNDKDNGCRYELLVCRNCFEPSVAWYRKET